MRNTVTCLMYDEYEYKLWIKKCEYDEDAMTLKEYAEECPESEYHLYYIAIRENANWGYRMYFENPYAARNFIRWMYRNCPVLLDSNDVLETYLPFEDMYDDEWIILA